MDKSQILNKVSSYEILHHFLSPYTGGKRLRKGELIKSPIRSGDSDPSFNIYPSNSGDWLYNDFGKQAGDCFSLVMELYNCNFKEALEIVNSEMQLGLGNSVFLVPPRVKIFPPNEIKPEKANWFEVTHKKFSRVGLNYWELYKITTEILKSYHVNHVLCYSALNKKGSVYTIHERSNLIFSYHISETCEKIYKPLDKKFRFQWLGNKPNDYVFGLEQLPATGDAVLFVGGEKDVMSCRAINIDAISLNSETAKPSEQLLADLRKRFKLVASLYDNDKTGIAQAQKLNTTFNIPIIHLPQFDEGKDISDWVKAGKDISVIDKQILAKVIKIDFPLPGQEQPVEVLPAAPINSTKRTYADYLQLIEVLNIPLNPDFAEENTGIRINYKTLSGTPYKVAAGGGAKVEAFRNTLQFGHIKCVYVPPATRKQKKVEVLVLVPCEIEAYILSESGIPAIGIKDRNGWLSKGKAKRVHPLVKSVLNRGVKKIIYMFGGDAYTLPVPEKIADKYNPYEKTDVTTLAKGYIEAMMSLEELLREYQVFVSHASLNSEYIHHTKQFWITDFLYSFIQDMPTHWKQGIREDFVEELKTTLITNYESSFLTTHYISNGNKWSFKKILFLDEPQRFYNLHASKLGRRFQLEKHIYEVDREGKVSKQEEAADMLEVWQQEGCFYGWQGRNMKRLSNFDAKILLMVRSDDDTFCLVKLENWFGDSATIRLSTKEFTEPKSLFTKLTNFGDFVLKSNANQLVEIYELISRKIKDARLLTEIGHHELEGISPFYIWGNGLFTYDGTFKEIDEDGVVTHEGKRFFLPAYSKYSLANQKKIFDHQIRSIYEVGTLEFSTWINKLLQVYGMKGHSIFMFCVASLFRDILFDNFGAFPMLYLQGDRGSGKSRAWQAVSKLFDNPKVFNIQTKSTTAAFNAHIAIGKNRPVPYNEYNISKIDDDKIYGPKGWYDGEGRTRMVDSRQKWTETSDVLNGAIFIGQESIWRIEAISTRSIVEVFEKTTFTAEETRNWREFNQFADESITHFTGAILTHRSLIKFKAREVQPEIEDFLKDNVTVHNVDTRLFLNWSIVLTPLFILTDEGKLDYPISKKRMYRHALENIKRHVEGMQTQSLLALFFQFIESEAGARNSKIDDRYVFVYEPKNELRISIKKVWPFFQDWLTRRSITGENQGYDDLLKKLKNKKQVPAYKGKSLTYMGYKRNKAGQILTRNGKNVFAKSTCLIFDLERLDLNINTIDYGLNEEPIEVVTA